VLIWEYFGQHGYKNLQTVMTCSNAAKYRNIGLSVEDFIIWISG
jgi:hypothetical protein